MIRESRTGGEGNSDGWGHKVTLVIYVEGDEAQAAMACDCIEAQVMIPNAAFYGVSVERVQDSPRDQGGS